MAETKPTPQEIAKDIDDYMGRQHWCYCGRLTPPSEKDGPCPGCGAMDIPSVNERLGEAQIGKL